MLPCTRQGVLSAVSAAHICTFSCNDHAAVVHKDALHYSDIHAHMVVQQYALPRRLYLILFELNC
jgi:hypothetical protein